MNLSKQKRSVKMSLNVKVGDILYSSWGYDQTNIDFYEVLKVTKSFVTVIQIKNKVVGSDDGFITKVVPDKGNHYTCRGENNIYRRKIGKAAIGDKVCVRIRSYSYAFPWDGEPKTQTSYA
jgi:hypothetical protein